MRRAVVHLGLPRTGTTTLQRVLFRLRPELARAGILYPALQPRSAAAEHLNHQHLGEALDGRRPARERTELLDSLSGQLAATDAELVLLSYEGLCLIPAGVGAPRLLAELFARHGFALEVVATIKPQGEHLNSTYTWRTQFLREGRRFPEYFRREIGARRLDLAALLAPWREAAAGRIAVVPVRDPRSDRPLLERFLEELELLPRVGGLVSAADTALVENRSPGPVAVEVFRRLRRGGAHLRRDCPAREVTRFVEEAARARGLDAVPFKGLDPALRAAAETRWAARNEHFARLAWGEPWSARVATEPARPVNELARTGEHGEEVAALLHEACGRFGLELRGGPVLAAHGFAAALGAGLGQAWRYGRALAGVRG